MERSRDVPRDCAANARSTLEEQGVPGVSFRFGTWAPYSRSTLSSVLPLNIRLYETLNDIRFT